MALKIGSSITPFFNVGRGARQGCPLSPFLFSLMIEPLAVALLSSPEVGALEVGTNRECLVDDILLFLKDPDSSLRAVFNILDTFSGLKVNWDKSTILPLDLGTKAVADAALPLQWVTHFTCLGVRYKGCRLP